MLQSLGRVVATQAASLKKTMSVRSPVTTSMLGSHEIKCLAWTSEVDPAQEKIQNMQGRKKKKILNFFSSKIIVTPETCFGKEEAR